jgi:hypothetical protein
MFSPVVNMPVDAFYIATDQIDRAFDSDGTCSRRIRSVDVGGVCEIDHADQVTQSDGNAELYPVDVGEDGTTVWVWTGAVGDEYDEMGSTYVMLDISPEEAELGPPDSASVTSDQPEDATHARYGTRVTFTIQLQSDGDDVPREKGMDSEVKYSLSRTTYHNPTDDNNNDDITDDTNGVWARTTDEIDIGRDGSATFSVTASDPGRTADSDNDMTYVVWELTGGGTVIGANTEPAMGAVIFAEADAVVSNIEIETTEFRLAPDSGSANHSVKVTVTDQFGNPVRGAAITLESGSSDSVVPTRARTTNSRGEVNIGYRYSGGAWVETLTAIWDPTPGATVDDPDTDVDETNDHEDGMTQVYWATVTEDSASEDSSMQAASFEVLDADISGREIVVDSDLNTQDVAPVVVYYDSNDYFDVVAGMDYGPVAFEDFVEALEEALDLKEAYYAAEAADETQTDVIDPEIKLSWSSYEYDDNSDIARFTLTYTKA